MKKFINIFMALIICISSMFMLVGCEDTPLSDIIISNVQCSDDASIKNAVQPTELSKESDVFASIRFIESPKGMKYTAVWSYDDKEIKTEEKEMATDKQGVIVFPLEADKLKEGTLKLTIKYKEYTVIQKEITIK